MPDEEPKLPPGSAEPLILPRRRAAPLREAGAEEEQANEVADLADTIRVLSNRLTIGGGSATSSPAATDSSGRPSKRWKRTHEPGLGNAGESRASASSAPARPAPARKKKAPGSKAGVWIAGQAFCLGLLALGYFVGQLGGDDAKPGRSNGEAPEPARAPLPITGPHGVSEAAFQAVNTALTAAKAGDRATARQTLEAAQRQELVIPGLDYRLALLAIERTDMAEAKLRLESAIGAGQELAACCYVRAMLAGAIGEYGRASEECARAAYAEPFNARYLFFWAECLRRDGRLDAAIGRFAEALTRSASPADRDYIAFKRRLALIEAGKASEFSAELATQLKAEPGDPRWLLTAAAMALEVGDGRGAAAQFEKASHLLPAATFDMYVRDYLLIAHSTEKEIAPFYRRGASPAPPSSNVAAISVDPISWTLETADPAAWPSAARRRNR